MLDFYKGMDISFLPQCEEEGMVVKDFGAVPADALELAKRYGVNAIRLRIWNQPENVPESGGYCDFIHTAKMAQRINDCGLSFLLNFHYSDFWADPAKQTKPGAWKKLHGEALEHAVFSYTRDTLEALKKKGLMPDMVQIGNEIRSGLLFTDGELPDYGGMVRLVNAGIRGAREAGGESLKIMIHLDQGGRYSYLKEWFEKAFENGLEDFDIIGLSYYPFWHGTFGDLKNTMEQLAADYHKPIILAETAHAWRRSEHGFIDEAQEKIAGFPATPEGQRQVLELIMNISASLPDNMGQGIYYWEPFCVPKEQKGGWEENMGLLAPDGTVMEGIHAFEFNRENQQFAKAAKIYHPKDIHIPVGGKLLLPEDVSVLYYDGTLRKHPVRWMVPEEISVKEEGSFILEGRGEGLEDKVFVRVTVEKDKPVENLMQDPNFDAGLAFWEWEKSSDEAALSVSPEFIDPFPAPPVNTLRMEAVKNYETTLWQNVALQKAGTYLLKAEYMGTDTTGVNVELFLKTKEQDAGSIIHPTEHEWQEACVRIQVSQPQTIQAGLRVVSPPGYGMVRRVCLIYAEK